MHSETLLEGREGGRREEGLGQEGREEGKDRKGGSEEGETKLNV